MTPLVIFAAALSLGSAQYLAAPYSAYSGYAGYATPYAGYHGYSGACAYGACGNMYARTAYAAPVAAVAAAPVAAVAAPTSYLRKYQTQDELGRATFGHEQLTQNHAAVRDALGNVAGAYSYISPEGKVIKARYTAGLNGVQVESNALPVAPVETRAAPIFNAVAPAPVQLTPEVRAATLEHLQAVKEAEAASKMEMKEAKMDKEMKREKRALLTGYAPAVRAVAGGYPAELTEVILNPGHATAYRVDPVSPVLFRKRRAAGYPAELTEVILNPGHATAYRVDPISPLLAF